MLRIVFLGGSQGPFLYVMYKPLLSFSPYSPYSCQLPLSLFKNVTDASDLYHLILSAQLDHHPNKQASSLAGTTKLLEPTARLIADIVREENMKIINYFIFFTGMRKGYAP